MSIIPPFWIEDRILTLFCALSFDYPDGPYELDSVELNQTLLSFVKVENSPRSLLLHHYWNHFPWARILIYCQSNSSQVFSFSIKYELNVSISQKKKKKLINGDFEGKTVSQQTSFSFFMLKPAFSGWLTMWSLQFQYEIDMASKGSESTSMYSFWNLVLVNLKLSDELPASWIGMLVKVQPPWKVYLDGTLLLRFWCGCGFATFQFLRRRVCHIYTSNATLLEK